MNTNQDLINKYTFESYSSKEEIGYRLPNDIALNSFWSEITAFRKQKALVLPFVDQHTDNFWYLLTPALQKKIYEIDSHGKDSFYRLVKKEIEHELMNDSLLEEALYSSVIEGAFSTFKRLKELVNEQQAPQNINDQMVLNNYRAMQFIFEQKHADLSPDFILQLHKIVTEKTLGEDEAFAGQWRNDGVYIKDKRGQVIYTPPPAEQIQPAMEALVN